MIYNRDELHELNLSNYKIYKLVEEDTLRKINNKFSENLTCNGDFNEFSHVSAYFDSGFIYLVSAVSYYELTTTRPLEIDIAIHKKAKARNLPEWPSVMLYYFSDDRYHTGILNIDENGHRFKIYNLENTIIDIIYYRKKIGIEETKEILINYLNRKDWNLNLLYDYAMKLKCEKILKTYLRYYYDQCQLNQIPTQESCKKLTFHNYLLVSL